ncbi:MAG: hypothetical protein ABWZ02_12310 [Nakamurella sp.]
MATPVIGRDRSSRVTALDEQQPAAAKPARSKNAVPRRRSVSAGLRRVGGISASLVSTQALTSILGLAFWTLAARTFSLGDVGVAGAAVSMMMLLGSLGSLGIGTLLIARLPIIPPAQRRVLVRTCLLAAGIAGFLLAIVVPTVAIRLFGAENLTAIAGSWTAILGLALGTGLMSVVMVLDQAVLTIGIGSLQLERNVLASVVKIGALPLLGLAGLHGGMTIFLAWTIGTLVSLPLVGWRTRGGRSYQQPGPWVQPALLRGLGKMAISHHALNTTLQAALQILPIIVTLALSSQENAYFNASLMVTGFVFALPYAIAIGLFASAGGSEVDVLTRMRLTIPFSLGISLAAYLVLYPLAGVALSVFGQSYADEGVEILRILALAGMAFVIKDHYVALRRVQNRTTNAVAVMGGFLLVELVAAVIGASLNGTVGLCAAWVAVVYVEAAVLAVPLWRAHRVGRRQGRSVQQLMGELDTVAGDMAEMAAASSGPSMSNPMAMASLTEMSDLVTEVAAIRTDEQPVESVKTAKSVQPRSRQIRNSFPRVRGLAARVGEFNLFGPIFVLMAFGIELMALAADGSRQAGPGAINQALWIAGQVLIIFPAAARILLSRTSNGERVALAVTAGVLLQLSRRVLYPLDLVFHDELLHETTLRQIEQTGQLFSLNPLLPVSGYYPGLELVVDAVSRLTGRSTVVAVTVVLVAARVVLVLAIIGLIRALTGSTRAGAIGAVVYMCNPQFLFFNSQFSYQTVALPMAIFAIYVFAVRRRGSRWSLLVPLVSVAAVSWIHHLTAMLLVAAFAVWFAIELVLGIRGSKLGMSADWSVRHRQQLSGLLVMTVAGAAMSLLAALNPGSPVGGYLWSIFASTSTGVSGLAEGNQAKPLFSDSAGAGPAPWEQVLLVGSVLIVMASLIFALLYARSSLRRRDALGLVLALVALLYPIIPAGHLTVATAEVGDRAAGFVFVGLAASIGWWLASRRRGWFGSALIAAVMTVVFLGSVILGSGPTARQLPGPYLISADARSIDADNLAAADWMAENLPANSNIYADRVSGLLAAAVGNQFTVRHLSTGVDASPLLLDPDYTADDVDLIRRANLDYLIVDTRLSQGLPHLDVYIETGEFEGRTRTAPVSAAALQKFASVPGVDRIYDNGSIQIYDLRGLQNGN